jgi:hypothetical protein
MAWRDRLRDLLLAGGALAIGGCPLIPCGNANPDPCICGRPDEDQTAKMHCDQKRACEADGGTWDPYQVTDGRGGVISEPHCKSGSDGGLDSDGSLD